MEKIINTGVDVNIRNENLLTPLSIAVLNNNNEVIPALISAGANVNERIGEKSLLDIAIENRNFEVIRHLVEAGIELIAVSRNKKEGGEYWYNWYEYYTYFMWAVNDEDVELIELLIDLGIDINQVVPGYRFNETPVMTAIRKNNAHIVDILIRAGASLEPQYDIRLEDHWPFDIGSALDYALSVPKDRQNQEIINRILEEEPLVTNKDLSVSIKYSHDIETIKKILARVQNINDPCAPLEIPLMAAVGSFEICELLINAGADVNLRSDADLPHGIEWTALHKAVCYPSDIEGIKIIRLLIKSGADVNSISGGSSEQGVYYLNKKGIRPLMLSSDAEITRELLNAGADVNAQDADGRTALMYSVLFNKDIEQARLLIEAGADINKTNIRTRNALMFARATYESNEEVINYLIRAGADTSIEDPIPDYHREGGYHSYVYVTENFYTPDH